MNVIFIIGAVQSLIFFFLLLNKNNRSSSDKILSTWFLIMALHLLVVYILTPEFLNLFPHFVGIQVGFPLLHGPFLFFYINSLVAGRSRIRTYDYLHIIPFVITLLVLIPFFSQSASEKLEIINGVRSYRNEYFIIIIMQLSSGPAYIIWGLSLLRKHRIFDWRSVLIH